MSKILTLESVKENLKNINPNIKILGDSYINSIRKFKCECLIDGHIWDSRWGDLSKGKGCPKCAGHVISLKEIKQILSEISPNVEIISNEYENNRTKLKCKCKIDGYEWDARWCNLQKGRGCPKCGGTLKLTIDEIKEKLKDINPDIEILSNEYINCDSKLKCRCLIDNYEWEVIWSSLNKGKGCPKCANILQLTLAEVKDRLKEIDSNIEILSTEYKNNSTKLKCLCNECKNIWFASWGSLQQEHGCPICNNSKGEKEIVKYLNERNIQYTPQQIYDDLIGLGGRNLSYDFYLPNYNLLIEYQGKQHEKYVKGFHKNKKDFERQQEHDKRKKEYAESHNIKLLEIWYWDFNNVKVILEKELL